jgi:hypothetical protein
MGRTFSPEASRTIGNKTEHVAHISKDNIKSTRSALLTSGFKPEGKIRGEEVYSHADKSILGAALKDQGKNGGYVKLYLKTAETFMEVLAEFSEEVDTNAAAGGTTQEAHVTNEERAAKIKALTECPCSGFTAAHMKMLEAASDDQLTAFAERGAQIKAAQDAAVAKDTEIATLKAAQAAMPTAEELAALKTLQAEKKAADDKLHAELVAGLKTAQSAYTEDELKALPLAQLEKLVQVAKVPSFAGRGLQGAEQKPEHTFTPPNPYAEGIKALQTKVN